MSNPEERTKFRKTQESNTMMKFQVKKLTEHATIPTRGSKFAAGYDLSSAYDGTVPARGQTLLKTDLSIKVPDSCYGRIGVYE